jgi:outer membrane protein assembly factor BamB
MTKSPLPVTLIVSCLCLCVSVVSSSLTAAEPWTTYRGNAQRTGNTDGKPGPTKPEVLWVHRGQDHHIASPVPVGDRLFVSGFSGFNIPTIALLETGPKTAKRVIWSKSVPLLKLPTVSSPAVVGGRLVFGDGMHQTDGAFLHCLAADSGRPLWQLAVPGSLVHLEGSPTVAGGKVYLGGGAAGVICVDLDRVTLDGKETNTAAVRKILDKKWAELLAKYEVEKKKDPDFAVPPTEDMLPKPAPVRVWQQGEKKWHVDAPVAVAGNRVLVASAFLDKEKVGDRALYCLDAGNGKIIWRAPLQLNPWAGPSVLGNTVVVSGSSIGFDLAALKGAKGEVAAFDLATGKEKWRKAAYGGVLGCVALADGLAIATATDGKVRAFDLASGNRRWIVDAKTPFFAPPAVAGGIVYAADLKGTLHALSLTGGQSRWRLDLGTNPAVKAPGMVYAGPVLHGGRLYVATCNLAGPGAGKPTVVVCLGDR